jgi:hypothetical protein
MMTIIFPYFSMMCLLSREKAKNRDESTVYHTGNDHPNYYTTKTIFNDGARWSGV